MKERMLEPSPAHREAWNDLTKVLMRHRENLNVRELLALTAQMAGMVLAWQDQRISVEAHMKTLGRNIEIGNKRVLDAVAKMPTAGSA